MYKECRALAIAAATFGHDWRGLRVQFDTDCEAVAKAFARDGSRSVFLMDLIRATHLIAARDGFAFRVRHVPGVRNVWADMLSRGQVEDFLRACPHAASSPTIPQHIPTLEL